MSPSPMPDPERNRPACWWELVVIWFCIILLVSSCAWRAMAQHDHGRLPQWLLAHPAFASCCSNRDCETLSVPPQPASLGWIVTRAGRTYPPVAYSQTKVSEDGRFYACILPGAAQVHCLWAPPSGV